MGNFKFNETPIGGVIYIEPRIFGDPRGYFLETYNTRDFFQAGISCDFMQDNQSRSTKGVLRGLHFQDQHSQAKLVRVVEGEVFDVAVDLRRESPTFGKYISFLLNAEKHNMVFIPKGFAHGFLVLSDHAIFSYKCDDYYHPEDEKGLIWNDPTIGIEWPLDEHSISLSTKDRTWSSFSSLFQ